MTRLKVAVVSDALYPWHKGGKEVRYLHLLNGLPNHDIDVVVYSMKWWDRPPEKVVSDKGSLTFIAICPLLSMYKGRRRSILQALIFAASTLRLLAHDFDVIEADHMPYLQLIPLRIVAWVKRVPLVITWNEVWGRDRWRSYLGPIGSIAALVERTCIHLPDAIISISSGTAEKLEAIGAKQHFNYVVPVALNLEGLLDSPPQPSAPELLFVGRLIEHKHADLAIEATRILIEREIDVRLGIVGVGPEELRLRQQVVDADIESHVKFYSTFESQQELWSLLRSSRVLLAPSVREGLGLVVAESLALGTPVVCVEHDENESANLVGPSTGSLVPAFDADALADAAEYWLNDQSSRSERISFFHLEHEELTVNTMTTSYAEIFRTVTSM